MDHFDDFLESYFTEKMASSIYGVGILWFGCIKDHTRDDLRKQDLTEDELDWIEDMFCPNHPLKGSRYEKREFSEATLEAIGIKAMQEAKYGDFCDHAPWDEFYGPNAE